MRCAARPTRVNPADNTVGIARAHVVAASDLLAQRPERISGRIVQKIVRVICDNLVSLELVAAGAPSTTLVRAQVRYTAAARVPAQTARSESQAGILCLRQGGRNVLVVIAHTSY